MAVGRFISSPHDISASRVGRSLDFGVRLIDWLKPRPPHSLRYASRGVLGLLACTTPSVNIGPEARWRNRCHKEDYRFQGRHVCEDIEVLRRRLRPLERGIERMLNDHEVGCLLTAIHNIEPRRQPASSSAIPPASATRRLGRLRRPRADPPSLSPARGHSAALTAIGHVPLRPAHWVPRLTGGRTDCLVPRAHERLRARGKLRSIVAPASASSWSPRWPGRTGAAPGGTGS